MGKSGWGAWIFFMVPLFLWLILVGTAKFNRRNGRKGSVFTILVGGDNRLSLSRLQAFAWTMVIVASWAAAMTEHFPILANHSTGSVTYTDAEKLQHRTNLLNADLAWKKAQRVDAKTQLEIAEKNAALRNAEKALVLANENLKKLPADPTAISTRANAQKSVEEAKSARAKLTDSPAKAWENLQQAREPLKYDWVQIPAGLLALAGIAVGSGVFSSLISATGSEEAVGVVTSVRSTPKTLVDAAVQERTTAGSAKLPLLGTLESKEKEFVLNREKKDNFDRLHPDKCLVIVGSGMKKQGTVSVNGSSRAIRDWSDDGTTVVVDIAPNTQPRNLIVDTAAGKLTYEVGGTLTDPVLGQAITRVEVGDLFRDDKDPSIFSLMKFQMFAWTVVAIGAYVYLFLSDLNENMASLPIVDSTIVLLTGLSSTGYLAGKGVSNLKKPGS